MNDTTQSTRITILFLFWALVAVFVFTLLTMFVPVLQDNLHDAILWQAGALFLLGALLIARTSRASVDRSLKRLLILVGGSALGIVLGFLGHNLMYALGTLVENVRVLAFVVSMLEVAFFLASIFLFPATFVFGAAGVIVMLLRGRQTPYQQPPGDPMPNH